jgi:hypothetical protein
VQRKLVEAWGLIDDTFIGSTFKYARASPFFPDLNLFFVPREVKPESLVGIARPDGM